MWATVCLRVSLPRWLLIPSPPHAGQAHFTLGFIGHGKNDAQAAAQGYNTVLFLANSLTEEDRAVSVSLPGQSGWEENGSGTIVDTLVHHTRENLKLMGRDVSKASQEAKLEL